MPQSLVVNIHHLGVQTTDLDGCLEWYVEFFGAQKKWELDTFSELTLRRVPGIRRLIEVSVGDVRIHLFDRDGHSRARPDSAGYVFQHACVSVSSPEEIVRMKRRWSELYESKRFSFVSTEQPTEIVVDEDGVHSMYLLDPNGLEYELAYVPGGDR